MKTNKVNACESIVFFSLYFLFLFFAILKLKISRNIATNCLNLFFSVSAIVRILKRDSVGFCLLHVYCHRSTMLLFCSLRSGSIVLYLENNYFVNCMKASAGICLFWNRAQLSDVSSSVTYAVSYALIFILMCSHSTR